MGPSRAARGRRARILTAVLAGLGLAGLALAVGPLGRPAGASDVPAARDRLIGHPRARFPLTVHAEAAPEPALDAAIREAVDQWNRVFTEAFAVPAFRWRERAEGAEVIIRFAAGEAPHLMGQASLDSDDRGVIGAPVEIVVIEPRARGQTSAERLLFQVALHELGHALGLPHVSDPASVMCCERGALNLDDPAVRDAYIAARRRPDLRSVLPQLTTHYREFWRQVADP